MGRHRFLKEVCSFDGAFQVHSVEPGQDCKRALFIGQGDCTYMRAEDIEGSNLLDLLDILGRLAPCLPEPELPAVAGGAAKPSAASWENEAGKCGQDAVHAQTPHQQCSSESDASKRQDLSNAAAGVN